MNKQQLKTEALKRMEALELLPDVLERFQKEDKLYLSERQNQLFKASLYYIDDDKLIHEIDTFEKEYSALVYHVQLTHTIYGDMYSFLYVSNHEEEWPMNWENIKEEAFVYVINGDIKEFGSIGIKPYMGGITRTW